MQMNNSYTLMILKKHVKKFTAKVEEKASFEKYNINNNVDSINLNELIQLIMQHLYVFP
jgi:hypothetical protein